MNRFIEETHMPAYTNGMGRGTVPPDSPEFLNRSRREALKKIDCVVLAGTLLDFRMRFGKTIPADAKIIQLDMDATLIGQNRAADVGLVGNLACSFELLLEEMKNQGVRLDFSGWRDELRAIETKAESEGRGGARAATRCRSTRSACAARCATGSTTLGDPIVIGDGGDIVATAAKILPGEARGRLDGSRARSARSASACRSRSRRSSRTRSKRVVIVYGDGSFGLNGFEYDTAVRFDLPIIGVVGNDARLGPDDAARRAPSTAGTGCRRRCSTTRATTRWSRRSAATASSSSGPSRSAPRSSAPRPRASPRS